MSIKIPKGFVSYHLPGANPGHKATTMAVGEEGGPKPKPPMTTMAVGEEGGGKCPPMTTMAVGEEGGGKPWMPGDGFKPAPEPSVVPTKPGIKPAPEPLNLPTKPGIKPAPEPEPWMTTMAVGEEGGRLF